MCSSKLFSPNYGYEALILPTEYKLAECVEDTIGTFENHLKTCNKPAEVTKASSNTEKQKFHDDTVAYNKCLDKARDITAGASCKDYIKKNPPQNNLITQCYAAIHGSDQAPGFYQKTIDVCKHLQINRDPSTKKMITPDDVKNYNTCLTGKWNEFTKDHTQCRDIYWRPLPLVDAKQFAELCAPIAEEIFFEKKPFKKGNRTVQFDQPQQFAWECTQLVRKTNNRYKKWTVRTYSTESSFVRSAEGKIWNRCMKTKIEDWVKKNSSQCQEEVLKRIYKFRRSWRIRNPAKCANYYKTKAQRQLNQAKVFPTIQPPTSVLAARKAAIASFKKIIKQLRQTTSSVCGRRVRIRFPRLSNAFSVKRCLKRATRTFNNHVIGCQRTASRSRKTWANIKKDLRKCIAQGRRALRPQFKVLCGKFSPYNINNYFNRSINNRRKKIIVGLRNNQNNNSGHVNKNWSRNRVRNLSRRQFFHHCAKWVQLIDNSSTRKEYRQIRGEYNKFLAIYRGATRANARVKCHFTPHPWAWVKAHQHVTHEYTMDHSTSTRINNLLTHACPRGINFENSRVCEAEHSEVIIGHTEQESANEFQNEAQWWIGRLGRCQSEEEYFRVRHQYYHLIEEYELHNVHVRASAPSVPSWSDVCNA
jgi:hypothetical protein